MERSLTYGALFAALIAALGLLPKISLTFGVPITAQSMGIMLCGTLLGAKRGSLSVLLFLLLVALGLPLLSGGRGGLGLFVSVSGGFLISWPVAAFVTGWIVEKWRGTSLKWVAMVASLAGCVVMYVFGIAGMAIVLKKSFTEATMQAMVFVPGDILKAVMTGFITSAIATARPASLLSRPSSARS